jgi:hypothetical protein
MSLNKSNAFVFLVSIILLSACLSAPAEKEMPSNQEKVVINSEIDPENIVSKEHDTIKDKIELKVDRIIYSKENRVCIITLLSEDFTPLSQNEEAYYKDCCTVAKETTNAPEIEVTVISYVLVSKNGEVSIEASYGISKASPIKNYWDDIFRVKDYKKTVNSFLQI